MSFVTVFIIFAVGAYLLQIVLGLQQLKHFNQTFQMLRRKGKVAIGKRPGKIKAGTIVMFALDDEGIIIDAYLMQGVTVLAKFKPIPEFIGQDIHYIDKYNALVRQYNTLVQAAMENARELYLSVQLGTYVEQKPSSVFGNVATQISATGKHLLYKLKGSV